MIRRGLICVLFTLLFPMAVGGGNAVAAGGAPAEVLVLYEGTGEKQDAALAAGLHFQAILGHFNPRVKLESVARYSGSTLNRFDSVFFIGTYEKYALPPPFLQDVVNFSRTLCWMGNGLGQLPPAQLARWNLRPPQLDKSLRFESIVYQGKRLHHGELPLNVVSLIDPSRSTVLARAVSARGESIPYMLRTGDFWFTADDPFENAGEGDRSVAFADALHDLLRQPHAKKRQAILRIEDVNLSDDVEDLRDVADLLYAKRVPFIISLIPVYVNPEEGTNVAISSRRDFVRAIQYMIARGGTVIMHGDTHQYRGISADDYEFWDASKSPPGPIREDSASRVHERLAQGLRVCFDSGLYPIAWEMPHYAASTVDYNEVAKYFSTVVEQRIYLDTERFAQAFPFHIRRDCYGQQVVPENCGYVPTFYLPNTKTEEEDVPKEMKSVKEIIANARSYSVVRDAFAGAFFHPYLKTELLAALVDGMRDAGYTFVDLRSFNNVVTFEDKCVITGSGTMRVKLHNDYLREIWLDVKGGVRREQFSATPLDMEVSKPIKCPPSWTYVAEGARSRPPSALKSWTMRASETLRALSGTTAPRSEEARVAILWNAKANDAEALDQQSFERAYQTAGFKPARIDANEVALAKSLAKVNWLIVPQAAAKSLTREQCKIIVERAREGTCVVTDGYSTLSEQLGVVKTDKHEQVNGAVDKMTQLPLPWTTAENVCFPDVQRAFVIYRDSVQDLPLAFSRELGKGRVIFLAALFDPITGYGYARFPTLVANGLQLSSRSPALRSPRVELFFDPAYRENISIEQLAVRWQRNGVRAVHVGMWHDYSGYAQNKARYDYERLLRNCHANGVLVYAWFELPYLTEKFWREHPEWRERNWRGEEVKAGWRWPLAMEVPACKEAVFVEMNRMLSDRDWDGVNLAELNFESPGPEEPQQFQPMHSYFRRQFQNTHGFDPAEVMDSHSPRFFKRDARSWQVLEDARVELVTQLHREVLEWLDQFRRREGKKLEVIVTMQDSLHAPKLRKEIGVDASRILALMKQFDFTLNVEDPEEMWNLPPDRYERIGADYRRLVSNPQRLMLDINVVDLESQRDLNVQRKTKASFAASSPTGAELTALIHSALTQVPRVVIYSESSIFSHDLPLLAGAYASVNGERWLNDTEVSREADERANGGIPLPHLVHFTGEILSQRRRGQELDLRYRARTRCLLSLASVPERVWVDDEVLEDTFRTGHSCHTIALPAGEHHVRILQEARALYNVQVFGSMLSNSIVDGGGLACFVLLGMLAVNRFRWQRTV